MIKIHISTARFGEDGTNFNLISTIPNQINNKYDITISAYTNSNTLSRANSLHPRTKGKIPKMLEWMNVDADYYVWIDEPFKIKSNNFGDEMLDNLGDNDICLYNHVARNTIYGEMRFVVDNMKDGNTYLLERYKGEPMEEQVNSYLSDINFTDNTLFNCGFFVYRKELIKNRDYNLMTDWFFHNCYWSIEDQLSLPYLFYKHNIKYSIFKDGNVYNNKYIK